MKETAKKALNYTRRKSVLFKFCLNSTKKRATYHKKASKIKIRERSFSVNVTGICDGGQFRIGAHNDTCQIIKLTEVREIVFDSQLQGHINFI